MPVGEKKRNSFVSRSHTCKRRADKESGSSSRDISNAQAAPAAISAQGNWADIKELNVNLLERLDIVERIESVIEEGGDIEAVKKQLEFEKKLIKRKLYQEPPASD